MAPEIHINEPYTGERVDLFASAVILFQLITKLRPFDVARLEDKSYYHLVEGNYLGYW